jgi:hypothetical protein
MTENVETEKMKWKITTAPDGSFPADQVTHAILMDVRETLWSIRKMSIFFTVVFAVSLALGLGCSRAAYSLRIGVANKRLYPNS